MEDVVLKSDIEPFWWSPAGLAGSQIFVFPLTHCGNGSQSEGIDAGIMCGSLSQRFLGSVCRLVSHAMCRIFSGSRDPRLFHGLTFPNETKKGEGLCPGYCSPYSWLHLVLIPSCYYSSS